MLQSAERGELGAVSQGGHLGSEQLGEGAAGREVHDEVEALLSSREINGTQAHDAAVVQRRQHGHLLLELLQGSNAAKARSADRLDCNDFACRAAQLPC